MKIIWTWVIKTLRHSENHLPRICLLRLFALDGDERIGDKKYNWVAQLKDFLQVTSSQHLADTLDPDMWLEETDTIFERYRIYLHQQDLNSMLNSSSCQLKIPRLPEAGPALYLKSRLPIAFKRTIAQLRLANTHVCYLKTGNLFMQFSPQKTCGLCHLHEPDTISHFLLRCPFFLPHREDFLRKTNYASANLDEFSLIELLCNNDWKSLKILCFCVMNCMRLRDNGGSL